MAYDEELARRVRAQLRDRRDVTERRMFGGLCFLANGRMCAGVLGRDLIGRVAREDMPTALRLQHVRPMDFTGRPLAGFVFVAAGAIRGDADLRGWIARGLAVADAQGPKKGRLQRRRA
jgi:hypothetical protein